MKSIRNISTKLDAVAVEQAADRDWEHFSLINTEQKISITSPLFLYLGKEMLFRPGMHSTKIEVVVLFVIYLLSCVYTPVSNFLYLIILITFDMSFIDRIKIIIIIIIIIIIKPMHSFYTVEYCPTWAIDKIDNR